MSHNARVQCGDMQWPARFTERCTLPHYVLNTSFVEHVYFQVRLGGRLRTHDMEHLIECRVSLLYDTFHAAGDVQSNV